MKICFVTFGLSEFNGYGRTSLNLIRGLKKLGVEGPILTLSDSPIPKDLSKRAMPLLKHKPTSPLRNSWLLFHDWRLIQKHAKGCQGIHFITESFLATTIFGFSQPYIVTVYGTWAIQPLKAHVLSRWVFQRAYRTAGAIISISKCTQRKLRELLPFKADIENIYLGIEVKGYSRRSKKRGELRILSVGALNQAKGFETSIQAVAKLAQQSSRPVIYTIVSGRCEPAFERELVEIAQKLHFSNLVFRYQVSDKILRKLYKEADIFLITPIEVDGDFEGFGLIFLEAFAAKLPVIASSSGAVSETVRHEETGLLVKENDVEDTINALKRVVRDKAVRQRCVKNGWQSLSRYSIEQMAKKYYQVYRQKFT